MLEAVAAKLYPAISPGQRALCRLVRGEPPRGPEQAALYAEMLGRAWGEDLAVPRPRVVIRAGRGASKSLIGAWSCIDAALTADVSGLAPGEVGKVLVVAPKKDGTRAVMGFVRGFASAEALRADLLGEPLIEVVRFRRGVEIEARAADKGGLSMRSVPVLGAVLDEANFFRDEVTGAVNDRDIVEAAEARLVPGGQILLISSSWVETGLFYDQFTAEFGRSAEALAVQIPHPRFLNPAWQMPPGMVEGSVAYRREVIGEWVREGSDALATRDQVATCMAGRGDGDLAWQPGIEYRDALDLAGSGHRTGYALGHRDAGDRVVVDVLRGYPATMPVEDRLRDIARLRAAYHVAAPVACDQFSFHAAQALGRLVGVGLALDTGARPQQADAMASLLREARVSLPASPRLRAAYPAMSLRRASGGALSLVIPARDQEGGHFDEAVAVMLLASVLRAPAAGAVVHAAPIVVGKGDWTERS